MTTINPFSDNPFVTIHNDIIDIRYDKKEFRFALENVKKIWLSKRKTNSFISLLISLLPIKHSKYKLYIRTKDNQEITIHITDSDTLWFVTLISWIRAEKNGIPLEKPIQFPIFSR